MLRNPFLNDTTNLMQMHPDSRIRGVATTPNRCETVGGMKHAALNWFAFQQHAFHLLKRSPYPFFTGTILFVFLGLLVFYFHNISFLGMEVGG